MAEADRNIFPASLPFFPSYVSAGMRGEFEEEVDRGLDLRGWVIEHPAATFLVRAGTNLMTWAGIRKNDILVVDRSVEPRQGSIVIAFVKNTFVVRRLHSQFDPESIWGVVTSRVRLLPGCPNITLL